MSDSDVVNTYTAIELQNYFKARTIERPVCLADPEYSLPLFFQVTCHLLNIPGSHGTIYNLAWTYEFFSALQPDCLVIDYSVAAGFESYLKKKTDRLRVPYILYVTSGEAVSADAVLNQIDYIDHTYVTLPHVN